MGNNVIQTLYSIYYLYLYIFVALRREQEIYLTLLKPERHTFIVNTSTPLLHSLNSLTVKVNSLPPIKHLHVYSQTFTRNTKIKSLNVIFPVFFFLTYKFYKFKVNFFCFKKNYMKGNVWQMNKWGKREKMEKRKARKGCKRKDRKNKDNNK